MLLPTIKKFAVIITIAILFSVFTLSFVEVLNERPDYSDYCKQDRFPSPLLEKQNCTPLEPSSVVERDCSERHGTLVPEFEDGCIVSYSCDTCQMGYDEANKAHKLFGFIVTSILGLIAVLVGLYVDAKEEVVQWLYSGFIIGGIISIFIGTITYFSEMNRFIRPLVMICEMILIVFVALRTSKSQSHKTRQKN